MTRKVVLLLLLMVSSVSLAMNKSKPESSPSAQAAGKTSQESGTKTSRMSISSALRSSAPAASVAPKKTTAPAQSPSAPVKKEAAPSISQRLNANAPVKIDKHMIDSAQAAAKAATKSSSAQNGHNKPAVEPKTPSIADNPLKTGLKNSSFNAISSAYDSSSSSDTSSRVNLLNPSKPSSESLASVLRNASSQRNEQAKAALKDPSSVRPVRNSGYPGSSMRQALGAWGHAIGIGGGSYKKQAQSAPAQTKPKSLAELTAPVADASKVVSEGNQYHQSVGDSMNPRQVSSLNSAWSRLTGYTKSPPQPPQPPQVEPAAAPEPKPAVDYAKQKQEQDWLDQRKQEALRYLSTIKLREIAQQTKDRWDKFRENRVQTHTPLSTDDGSSRDFFSARTQAFQDAVDKSQGSIDHHNAISLAQSTATAVRADAEQRVPGLLDHRNAASGYISLREMANDSIVYAPKHKPEYQKTGRVLYYTTPTYMEPYHRTIDFHDKAAVYRAPGDVRLADFGTTMREPQHARLATDARTNGNDRNRALTQLLHPKIALDTATAYDLLTKHGDSYRTDQSHIANIASMSLVHRMYRYQDMSNVTDTQNGVITYFAHNPQASSAKTQQRNPEDIKPPKGSQGVRSRIDFIHQVQKLKKQYGKITPAAQVEYVHKAVEEYKKEAETASYDELVKHAKTVDCQLSFVYEEYRQLTGSRNIPDVQAYSTGDHRVQIDQANEKTTEEQSRFYEQHIKLRQLERQYAVLQSKAQYNEKRIAAYKQEMQKKNDDYQQSISQHGFEKLVQEEMPLKEKQLADTQKNIQKLSAFVAHDEKALEKAADRLASFDRGFMEWALAHTKAALDSDKNYQYLAEKKAKLEDAIRHNKKNLAKLKNEQIIQEEQLEYIEKRVERYHQLQEAYAPFVGVPQAKMNKEDLELQQILSDTITNHKLGCTLIKDALPAHLDPLLLQSNIDKKRFEELQGDAVQNLMYQKFNTMLKASADAQDPGFKDATFKPYNQAVALLWAHGQEQNRQGQTNAAIRTYMVANSISQYVQAKSSGDAAAIKKAEQGIGDSLGQAIQKINDGATLAELKDSLDTQIDRSKETQKWLTILGAVAVVTLDNPANGPAALAGVVAVALSEIVSTQVAAGAVAVAGAAAAGGAADPKAEFFNKIDDAFKTDKVANAIKEYKDRAVGGGTGCDADKSTTPDFIKYDRLPQDRETILSSSRFEKTKIIEPKGSRVYKHDGKYYHRDTLHRGKGAHLEVYNSRGQHLGEADPLTGELIPNTAKNNRWLKL